jgi:hypothetical protein
MPMKNKARRRVAICMYFSNKLLNGIQLDVNFPEKAAFTSTTKDTGRAEFVFVIAQFADCGRNSGMKRHFIPLWPPLFLKRFQYLP